MKTILKVIVGSQAHGLATPQSDYDYRGVFVTPTIEFLRVGAEKVRGTQWIEGKEDDTSWEIGHFLNLATHCNPTILEVFMAPKTGRITRDYTQEDGLADDLRALFPHVWNSVSVYNAFRGYSKNQQKKFLDKKDARPHKYASAYLRVLYQGVELLRTGRFPVNFRKTPIYNTLVKWKNKEYTVGEVMDVTAAWEELFLRTYEQNPNKETDLQPVNEFLLRVRKEYWE